VLVVNREEARTRLAEIVSASTPPVLSTADLDAALDASRVVDADGRAPVDEGYLETFDLDYAAAEAFDLKADRALATDTGGLESFTSEGSAFKRRPGTGADGFQLLAVRYRGRSLAAATGPLSVIEVSTLAGASPRSATSVVTNAD
jgi:hypothetical protein